MAQNPETLVTNRFRKLLTAAGAHVIKISDAYTRGIPDLLVSTTDGICMIEIKVDKLKSDKNTRTYKSLGLSGAQDHHVRQLAQRRILSGCVVTDIKKGGKLRLWIPLNPEKEGGHYGDYSCVARGWEEIREWLSLTPQT